MHEPHPNYRAQNCLERHNEQHHSSIPKNNLHAGVKKKRGFLPFLRPFLCFFPCPSFGLGPGREWPVRAQRRFCDVQTNEVHPEWQCCPCRYQPCAGGALRFLNAARFFFSSSSHFSHASRHPDPFQRLLHLPLEMHGGHVRVPEKP